MFFLNIQTAIPTMNTAKYTIYMLTGSGNGGPLGTGGGVPCANIIMFTNNVKDNAKNFFILFYLFILQFS